MYQVKAPKRATIESPETVQLFLAGSIEMGAAEKWQDRLVDDLKHIHNLTIWNPRRDDWDSSWVQDPTPGTQFHEQVTWELDHITDSDIVAVYFDPATKSPITLLELGLIVGRLQKAIIFCPPEFFRHGNVVITAARTGAPVFSDYEDFRNEIIQRITEEKQRLRRMEDIKRIISTSVPMSS